MCILKKILSKLDEAGRSLDEVRRLSYKERRENASVPRAEEGRDKLRKATGRSKYPSSRGCPNEGTHTVKKDCISIHE